jgi:transcriptional regulator with XRE-family HTH domain
VHAYRRFIQQQLDERSWKQADLVRKSGLSRQLIWSILSDGRDYLGQMPDESTLEGLAKGFGLPVEVFRTAAARSLVGFTDDGTVLTVNLQGISTDALLNEVRRRIDENESRNVGTAAPAGAPSEVAQDEEVSADDAERARVLERLKGRLSPDAIPVDHPKDRRKKG